jgi:patatin-like phospholipase/acyl hydrolase
MSNSLVNKSNSFQILALDGGGIKGLFSAVLLARFENDLNLKIVDYFDLITGTSTGGIIALGLASGMRPKDIVEFYKQYGSKIFHFSGGRISKFWKHLNHVLYSSNVIEDALQNCFGEKKISDCNKRVVIPSYDLDQDEVYLFKTKHHRKITRDPKVPIWKVAMATSAAPTYFPSFDKVDDIRLIDGGIWANNPSIVGITEAVNLLSVNLKNIRLLNIGTTSEVVHRSEGLNNGGLWAWKRDALSIALRGQSIGAFNQAQLLIGKENSYRIDPVVPDDVFDLDKLNISELSSLAASKSRYHSPKVLEMFLNHQSTEFKPKL